MKLLIITQKVDKNDSNLGFFHQWLLEFAKQVSKLTVICLEKGAHDLPDNVRVLSLGKEKGVGKLGRVLRLYKYIWQNRKAYSHVFVHMNQIYVVLCGWLWRLLQKDISLWYAHGSVSFSLKVAEKFAHRVFTSTPSGFRLPSKKLHVVGQGIDTELFVPDFSKKSEDVTLLTVGRISRVKNIHMLIEALQALPRAKLHIIGLPITEEDKKYEKELQQQVVDLGLQERVVWHGSKSYKELVPYYQSASIFVNMSNTGSLDKVMVEAIACGTPVVSCNEAITDIMGAKLIECKQEQLNDCIEKKVFSFNEDYRKDVVKNHSLRRLISVVLSKISDK